MEPIHVAGLLLTGGASRRMRTDKASADLGGETMAAHVARALCTVAHPVLAVGPASGTGLPEVDDPREGPLRALVAGADALHGLGWTGPALLLACDIPFVTPALLRHIADARGDADAAVPVLDGRDQPLAGCYSQTALARARILSADGKDAMRDLLRGLTVRRVPEEAWTVTAPPRSLQDIDTPASLAAARRTPPLE